MSIPIRIAVRVDFEDGSQHEFEVRGADAVTPQEWEFGWWPEPVVARGEAERIAAELDRRRERKFLLCLLRVAVDDEDLDPADYELAVVTAGRGEGGTVKYWPWEKGEVLAVPLEDLGSRDLREGRSFAKYDIREERFGRDWEAAQRRSAEVKAGPDVDMFARPEAP